MSEYQKIIRTTASDPAFITLIKDLDQELYAQYGATQKQYNQFNLPDPNQPVVLLIMNNEAVGCGSFKPFNDHSAEIKRMFVRPGYRGKGISRKILSELEALAKASGFTEAVLETAVRQTQAIGLYTSSGYTRTENYGQYKDMPNSICFSKRL